MRCRTVPVPGRDVLVVPIEGAQRFGRPKRINGGWLEMIKMDDYQDQRVGGCGGAVGRAASVQPDPERLGRLRVSLQVATQTGGDRLRIAGGGGGALHVAVLQVQTDPCGLLEVAPPTLRSGWAATM